MEQESVRWRRKGEWDKYRIRGAEAVTIYTAEAEETDIYILLQLILISDINVRAVVDIKLYIEVKKLKTLCINSQAIPISLADKLFYLTTNTIIVWAMKTLRINNAVAQANKLDNSP